MSVLILKQLGNSKHTFGGGSGTASDICCKMVCSIPIAEENSLMSMIQWTKVLLQACLVDT